VSLSYILGVLAALQGHLINLIGGFGEQPTFGTRGLQGRAITDRAVNVV